MTEQQFLLALNGLRNDRQHGASALARQALLILQRSAEQATDCDEASLRLLMGQRCTQLCQIRPSMAVINGLLARWQQAVDHFHDEEGSLSTAMADQAGQLIDLSLQAVIDSARHASQLVQPGQTLITHSCSSTMMVMFEQLQDQNLAVIVTESRPLNEGVAVAHQLRRWGMDVTLITDAQMGLFAARADLAMVGADSLLADGSVVNKAGTSLLALAANYCQCPFYVLAESYKRTADLPEQLILEQMSGDELQHDFPADKTSNIYFDVTAASLISGWIDEHGVSYDGELK